MTCQLVRAASRRDSGRATRRHRHLHDALSVLTRLLALFIPFVTERVGRAVRGCDRRLVHLASWPIDTAAGVDQRSAQMALCGVSEFLAGRRGPSERQDRQPLRRALVSALGRSGLPPNCGARWPTSQRWISHGSRTPATSSTERGGPRALGKLLGPKTQVGARAIATLVPAEVAAMLAVAANSDFRRWHQSSWVRSI